VQYILCYAINCQRQVQIGSLAVAENFLREIKTSFKKKGLIDTFMYSQFIFNKVFKALFYFI